MKKNELNDALSGIKKDYISESDDFKTVSADFRQEKIRKNRITVSTLCLVVVCVGVIGISQSSLLKRDLQTAKKDINTVSLDKSNTNSFESTIAAAVVTTEQQSVSENTIIDEPLYYSKLVNNTEIPELDGYDMSASLSITGFDIDAFEETMTNDSSGMIEGEIIDIWVNHYEYATASDKFEPNGRLYHKPSTVAYKIKVDRVFSGDFSVGDVVTIEDDYFILDSIISIKKGGHYVIPIAKGDGIIWEHDEVVSGNNVLESCYYTVYQFHPQIEKVRGGYVVPEDWKSLITDECTEIIMDTENNYNRKMYFVPESVFNDGIDQILSS